MQTESSNKSKKLWIVDMDFSKIESFFAIEPYSLNREEKKKALNERISFLHRYHYDNCLLYRRFVDFIDDNSSSIPFLPVRIFKYRDLRSTADNEKTKLITSSGTSGQQVSRIFLDKETSFNQQRSMIKIVSSFTGSSRMPMLIIDCERTIRDRDKVSARAAGILGFSLLGSKRVFALSDNLELDFQTIRDFLKKNQDRKILLFGFTYIIWQFFYEKLLKHYQSTGEKFDFSKAILIHGGGWKKLESLRVSGSQFKNGLKEICNIDNVYNYYGMAEQTGSIFMECEYGHLHCSVFSDIIIRDPKDFSVCKENKEGIVQVVSVLPKSYPGFSLLTDDVGIILGQDSCPCGRLGKFFSILGRLKKAEIRGCSDTFENNTESSETKDSLSSGECPSLTFDVGNIDYIKKMKDVPVRCVFSDEVIDFLSEWSSQINKHKESTLFTEVRAFAFFIRRNSLKLLKKSYAFKDSNLHLGKGVTFHIAPSNVPVNFAYSLFSALICGNSCIVKLPSKKFAQIEILVETLKKTLEKYHDFRKYICLIRYNRERTVTSFLSSLCDVRIIWGGDETIMKVRESPLLPHATEITFANRYSICLIDSDSYLRTENKIRVARDFYNDTFLNDQNACTSPKILIWVGEKIFEAKVLFFKHLQLLVEKYYKFEPIMGLDKYNLACLFSTSDDFPNDARLIHSENNLITRIQVKSLDKKLSKYYGNMGYFYEYECDNYDEIAQFVNNRTYQTLCLLSDSKSLYRMLKRGGRGIDRVVPIGRSLDFSLIWDGHNLLHALSREISFI